MSRHDPQRTGLAKGKSDLVAPETIAKAYLGGGVGDRQILVLDVDGDGTEELVLATGGKVVAKRADDSVVWETAPLGVDLLHGEADLDGDGKKELVVTRPNGALVLETKTGKILFAQPLSEAGTVADVRLADLTGDGKTDLVVLDDGCVEPTASAPVRIYAFDGGFAAAPKSLPIAYGACGTARSATVLDIKSTGTTGLLLAKNDEVAFVHGPLGQVAAKVGGLGTGLAGVSCVPVNLDVDGDDEVLCVGRSSASPNKDQKRVFAIDVSPAPAMLTVAYSRVIAPDDGDVVFGDLVADLDADGKPEILVSTRDASGDTLRVLDAKSGDDLVSVPGVRLLGHAPVAQGAERLILGEGLKAYYFERAPTPTINLLFSLDGETVLSRTNTARAARTSAAASVVTVDANGDGLQDLVTTTTVEPFVVALRPVKGVSAKEVASRQLPTDVGAQSFVALKGGVGVVRTDGFLATFDTMLGPKNAKPGAPGARLGGHVARGVADHAMVPRTIALGTDKSEHVLVPDGARTLSALPMRDAGLVVAPKPLFSRKKTTTPTALSKLTQTAAVVALSDAGRVLAVLPDGSELWNVGAPKAPIGDLVPAKLNSDSIPDFAVQWNDPKDTLVRMRALSGQTGQLLWEASPYDVGAPVSSGISSAELTGDASDDLVAQGGQTRLHSGKDGTIVTLAGSADPRALVVLWDIDQNGSPELVFTSGPGKGAVYKKDLSLLFEAAEDLGPLGTGGIAPCSAGAKLVVPLARTPWALRILDLQGANQGKGTVLHLGGGKLYASTADATAASAPLGRLSSVTLHQDLSGKGRPSALVGSTDGYLYAIDPCAGTLDWSKSFGAAVGEPVYGDVDGDGKDEVVVTAGDGYLHVLRQEVKLAAPTMLRDVDVCKPTTDDVDTTTGTDQVGAAWAAVTGAASYEAAVVDDGGVPMSKPAWVATSKPEVTVTGLSLDPAQHYRVAVRTVDAMGKRSVEALSDGFAPTAAPPACGKGGAGGASGAGGAAGGNAGAAGAAGKAGAQGGQAGAGAGGTGGSSLPSTGGAYNGTPQATPESDDGGGCGCATASPRETAGWAAVAAMLVLAARRRPKR